MKKLTEEWLRAAKDDLDVIEKILGEAHLSHITAFHAQQCIEKAFKGRNRRSAEPGNGSCVAENPRLPLY